MVNLTWQELIEKLNKIPTEKRNQTATIYLTNSDEFMPIAPIVRETTEKEDTLDAGHFYIETNF